MKPGEANHPLLGPAFLTMCRDCNTPVWILALHLDAHPDLKAVCNECAVRTGLLDVADLSPETLEILEEIGFLTKQGLAAFKESIKEEMQRLSRRH